MVRKQIRLNLPADFSFWRTVLSHGWCVLPPFYCDRNRKTLTRVLSNGRGPVLVEMRDDGKARLALSVSAHQRLASDDLEPIKSQVATMLRLEESMQEFHHVLLKTSGNGKFQWVPKARAGRLLRSPSLFEDVVKMICTTNCSWSATERMTHNLVQKLGDRFDEIHATFPSPSQLAATSESFLKSEIRSGYRSTYLLEFAENVASGRLDLDCLNRLDRETLYRQLLSIKGIGVYAAGNLMKLLGHYEHLALDSWCRAAFAALYRQGKPASDRTIFRHYQGFGRWKGLVMWLDLTQSWFEAEESQPF